MTENKLRSIIIEEIKNTLNETDSTYLNYYDMENVGGGWQFNLGGIEWYVETGYIEANGVKVTLSSKHQEEYDELFNNPDEEEDDFAYQVGEFIDSNVIGKYKIFDAKLVKKQIIDTVEDIKRELDMTLEFVNYSNNAPILDNVYKDLSEIKRTVRVDINTSLN